jgi:hypothetical protein
MGYENEKEKKLFNMLKNNATYMLFLYLKHPPPLFSTMHKTRGQTKEPPFGVPWCIQMAKLSIPNQIQLKENEYHSN